MFVFWLVPLLQRWDLINTFFFICWNCLHFYSSDVFILTKIQELLNTCLCTGYLHCIILLCFYNSGNCRGVVRRPTTRESAGQDFGSIACKFRALWRNKGDLLPYISTRKGCFLCNHEMLSPPPTSTSIFYCFGLYFSFWFNFNIYQRLCCSIYGFFPYYSLFSFITPMFTCII